MRTVQVTRYVAPLREGGSLPGLVEADDDGLYVLKFSAAGQGRKALIADLLVGEIARALDLPVPELVFAELDPQLGRAEPDDEIRDLLVKSGGLNLAMDFLPGALPYDPLLAPPPDPELAAAVVWLDGYTMNVDRTARNTNMLIWHRQLRLIDHGAALYVHHAWSEDYLEHARRPFNAIKDHVLLPLATPSALSAADQRLAPLLDEATLSALVALIPEAWLAPEPIFGETTEAVRRAYVNYLVERLRAPRAFVEEAIRAHAQRI